MVLPAAALAVVGVLLALCVVVYRVTHVGPVAETVNPSHYLLPSLDVTWSTRGGKEIPGWWIPGLRGEPGVVLAPGYGMTRGDALSLAAVLREQKFNVLLYDPRGSGSSPSSVSDLGLQETDDMLSALDFLESRPEVDRNRVGVWAVDVAARAALASAAQRQEIRAVAVDSAFETVRDFLELRIRDEAGFENRFLEVGSSLIFRLYFMGSASVFNEGVPLGPLSDRAILFIQGANRTDVGRLTAAIYERVQPQKEMLTLPKSRFRTMSGEELREYDRHVQNFFVLNLQKSRP